MSLLHSRFPFFYRFAAFVALLALLGPMGTEFAHSPAMAGAFIHLCGGEPSKAPAHKVPSCPICQSLHLLGGGAVPPASVTVTAQPFIRVLYVLTENSFVLKFSNPTYAQPRAPPSLV